LLGLAYVLAHDAREVDAVEVEPERTGHDLGRHRLAGAARAGEQDVDPRAERQPRAEAPLLEHEPPLLDPLADLDELALAVGRNDEVVDPEPGLDATSLLAEPAAGLRASGREERAIEV